MKSERLGFSDIRGVIPISGEYQIKPGRWPQVLGLGNDDVRNPSPTSHIDGRRPPFLLLYAEQDSMGVHRQSDELCASLRAQSSEAVSIEIKDRGHASIMHQMVKPEDATLTIILDFIATHCVP